MDVDSEVKMTSRRINAMKNTKRTKLRPRKLDHILRQVEHAANKKKLDPCKFNVKVLKAKYLELLEMKGKPASDWVVKLGVECFILYYCVGCDTAPTSANQWYRCCKKTAAVERQGQLWPQRTIEMRSMSGEVQTSSSRQILFLRRWNP